MTDADLEHQLGVVHPELITTTLLRHALAAARQALAAAHPELEAVGDLGEVDHDVHLALLIAIHVVELDKLLAQYHQLLHDHWKIPDDIPF